MELSAGTIVGRGTVVAPGGAMVRILQVVITDPQDVQNVQLVGQAGEECNPPDGSMVLINSAGEAYKLSAGTADTIEPVLAIGGKRIYSTDEGNTQVMASVQLDPDGTISVLNEGGFGFTISPTGVIAFLGTAMSANCSFTAPTVIGSTDVLVGGSSKSLLNHTHTENGTGGGTTGIPL